MGEQLHEIQISCLYFNLCIWQSFEKVKDENLSGDYFPIRRKFKANRRYKKPNSFFLLYLQILVVEVDIMAYIMTAISKI